MKRGAILSLAGIVVAMCVTGMIAVAQSPLFVGVWRGHATIVGQGGYGIEVDIEDVFQPDGKFSSITSSRYTDGPAAGGQIGATHAAGTYRVNSDQNVIEFHVSEYTSTQPGAATAPYDTSERYQFLSATRYSRQSLAGGPVITYQRVTQ